MSAVLPIARGGHLRQNIVVNIETAKKWQLLTNDIFKKLTTFFNLKTCFDVANIVRQNIMKHITASTSKFVNYTWTKFSGDRYLLVLAVMLAMPAKLSSLFHTRP